MTGRSSQAVYFLVSGRVQGVAFRWFGARIARELGVAGWIRNRVDGRVEGEAFGDASVVEEFLGRLRQGPPAARVDQLERRPIPDAQPPPSFEIRP
jgi:acylphosphatase